MMGDHPRSDAPSSSGDDREDATDEQLLQVLQRLGLCCARLKEGGFCGATATSRPEGLLVCDRHRSPDRPE